MILSCLFGTSAVSNAQIVPAGAIPQFSAGTFGASLNSGVVVNCDMIRGSAFSVNTIQAIVYGRNNCTTCFPTTAVSYLYIQEFVGLGGPSLTLQLPGNAYEPDVALASYTDKRGVDHFQAIVVWADGTDIYINPYDIGGIGTSTLTATPAGTWLGVKLNSPGTIAYGNPHIDMATDMHNKVQGYPSVHDYAVTWSEGASYQLRIYHGNLSIGGIFSGTKSFGPTNGEMADIAVMTDNTISQEKAFICYRTVLGSPALMLCEYNITTLMLSPPSVIAAVPVFSPRIEAMSQYSPGQAKWQIVTSTLYSPAQVEGYNDVTIGATLISSPLFSGQDIKAPCVAAGIGPVASYNPLDIGNIQYTAGMFPWGGTDLFERGIDASSGTLVGPSYYQVNDPSAPVNYPWDEARNFAVSNSSNSGLEILSAWYDGQDIIYKHSPNQMLYKPTSVTGAIKNAFSQIYPNPTSKDLHFDAKPGTTFKILDFSGHIVHIGVADKAHAVDVANLPVGAYILQRSDNAHTEYLPFYKH